MVVVNSFKPPESPVKLEQEKVTVVLDKKNLGCGKLFISERTLSWQKERDEGFSLEYFHISLHAVSRDPTVYEKDCIYILTDPHIALVDEPPPPSPSTDEEEHDENSEPNLSELILVPDNPSDIQSIYDSIKICQELNPDPADVDDDEDDNLYADAEEGMNLEPESVNHMIGDAVMDNLAERMQNNSVEISYDYSNGDAQNEDEFEDAD